MGRKICLVTGVGPGTGSSMVRRFASGGYNVIMVSRSEDRLNKLEKQIENTFSYPCDVSSETNFTKTIEEIKQKKEYKMC